MTAPFASMAAHSDGLTVEARWPEPACKRGTDPRHPTRSHAQQLLLQQVELLQRQSVASHIGRLLDGHVDEWAHGGVVRRELALRHERSVGRRGGEREQIRRMEHQQLRSGVVRDGHTLCKWLRGAAVGGLELRLDG